MTDQPTPQPAPVTETHRVLEDIFKISQGTVACGATDACFMAAYGQADHEMNKEWKMLPKEVQAKELPAQVAWLEARNESFGDPDKALEPGAMPATGQQGALASRDAVAAVAERTLELADIYDHLQIKK